MAASVSHSQDKELVLKLQQGDLEALGKLYDRHRRMVYATALAISGEPELAADLLQDVFLRLHRFAHRIDPKRPLEPWLYRMTANLSYSTLKRRSRLVKCLRELGEVLVREFKPTPHHIAERDEQWEMVRRAVAGLPLPKRVVVVLYYVNDLSVQEISEVLDVPVGTVKSRLHYGRVELKKQLGVHGEPVPEVSYELT